jgi:hypothetical protein
VGALGGLLRDSAMFSITAAEWPECRAGLERRITEGRVPEGRIAEGRIADGRGQHGASVR